MKNKLKFQICSLVIMSAFLTLTSSCKKTVTDIDGNVYKTVKIGNQLWMAENLKTTRYRNGDLIGTTTPATLDISDQTTPKYQWAYAGNEDSVAIYGRLYTWYTITDSRNICPSEWHVITDAEWTTLANYFGGQSTAGAKLKETGSSHWINTSTIVINSSGFTALPGGGRGSKGAFGGIGCYGAWWSSTESNDSTARYWNVYYNSNSLNKTNYHKNSGFSVRCVRDF